MFNHNSDGLTIAYLRTSHEKDDNFSLKSQEKEVKDYAQRNGITIDRVITETFTGTTLERPGLEKLVKLIHAGKVAQIIIWRVDRLSRTAHHTMWVVGEYILKNGILLHLTDNNHIVSDEFSSRVLISLYANASQEEHAAIKKRTQNGRMAKLASGAYLGQGTMILGYKKIGKKHDTVVAVDEDEAKIAALIFDLVGNDQTPIADIVRLFNAKGIQSPAQMRGRRGATGWDANNIRKIIKDPRYKGEWYQLRYMQVNREFSNRDESEWVRYNNPNLAIVDADLWARANAQKLSNIPNEGGWRSS